MTPSDIPLTCSISNAQKDALVKTGAFRAVREGMLFTDDDPISDPREAAVLAVTARCYMFDLTVEEQREKYADLISKIHAGENIESVWEERVTTPTGLVIYMTVLEYAQVTKNTLDRLDDEKQKQ